MKKKLLTVVLSFLMVMTTIPAAAFASTDSADVKTVNVNLSMEQANYYYMVPQDAEISSDLSDEYGYVDQVENGVSALDSLIYIHKVLFGDAFTKEDKDNFLVVSDAGFISVMLAQNTSAVGFAVNGFPPNDGVIGSYGTYTGYTVNQAKIKDGDKVQFFFYDPNGYYGEIYTNFLDGDKHITELVLKEGEEKELALKGYSYMYEGCNKEIKWKPVPEIQIGYIETEGEDKGSINKLDGVVTGEDGLFKFSFAEAGTYNLMARSNIDNMMYIIPQVLKVTVVSDAQLQAQEVDKLILEIGEVTLDSKDAIDAARAAYDALSDEAKEAVTNIEALLAAEEKYAELKAEADKDEVVPDDNADEDNQDNDGVVENDKVENDKVDSDKVDSNKIDNDKSESDKADTEAPKTGDTENMFMYVVILMVAAAGVKVLRRKNN